ncbi:MAG: CGNR zinc finger domain-containing protein [Nitrospiraceae bacterium]
MPILMVIRRQRLRAANGQMSDERTNKNFYFIGGYLCLDLINTQIVEGGRPVDLLTDFGDFVSWLLQARVLDAGMAKELIGTWGGTREAERTFNRAVDFRAALRHMMERIVHGKSAPQTAIARINELLHNQVGHTEIKRAKGGFEKHFQADFQEPIHLLWPVAESAGDLLTYGELSLIKKCENAACVLFFYDTTKNHSRRWCSMSACGNRMKVAAHYRRLRTSTPTS